VITGPLQTHSGASLQAHLTELNSQPLRELLRQPGRVEAFTFTAGDLTIDLSRARADEATLSLLVDLAEELEVPQLLQAMMRGDIVNVAEHRPALHTACRLPRDAALVVDGVDVATEVRQVYDRIDEFVDSVHEGRWLGATGNRIESVVNIGIGGSDLGPRTVVRALRAHAVPGISVHFVANVDPADLTAVLEGLNPETTLFVIVSKTFTTVETLSNARVARQWLTAALGDDAVSSHMVAVSAEVERAVEFGISADAVFGFWDWVGGRYSLSSPVGLSIQLAIGSNGMRQLRAGMHHVDLDLVTQPPANNGALMLGMLDVWYSTFCDYRTKAVIPYAQDLELLPAHFQQLQMESNGKSVTRDGEPVFWHTCPTVWGSPGTNGQHAFFQLLHQGTESVIIDLIGVIEQPDDQRATLLQANLVAQSAALANGQTAEELRATGLDPAVIPHRLMPGNRPSTVISLPRLDPSGIGQLIALYEHSTVVAGLAWGISPFDQWGVELGKALATQLAPALAGGPIPDGTDPATAETIARLRRPSA
jgi:glucose-6-phosphate isomerase